MMRRSRISVRPNVKPAGRALTASRDASAESVQPPQGPVDATPSEGSEVTAERLKTDPPLLALEQTNEGASQSSIPSDQLEDTRHGDRDASSKRSDAQDSTSTTVTSGPQRRKRFTALPNLAKPRAPPASSRTPKSPTKSQVKPVPPKEPETSTPAAASSLPIPEPVHNPKVPGRRRPSGGNRQAKTQPVPTTSLENDQETTVQTDLGLKENVMPLAVQQGESPDDTVLVDENASERLGPPAVEDIVVQQESDSGPTVCERQTDLLRERLQKLQSSSKMISSLKKVNDPADMVRLAQARKLRELLKKEMKKDKEDKKKPKMGIKERKAPKDHAKMTMRELIYYLPVSNPMKSFTDEEQKTSEIVLDDTPTPTSSKTPAPPSVQETAPEDAGHEEDEEGIEETQEEEPLLVPRVKVAEDGSLIIDEESLTVQVSRAKGPNPADDRDPIFERGSTTTYSSFRKGSYTKPWSNGETEMFFLAISMVGTDFSMIGQLFPHRSRLEIKNKFKKEEKNNSWRIDKAFKEKRRLDLDFFKKLMEQILEDEEKKKSKNKELVKMAKSQRRVRRKGRVAKITETDTSEDSDSDVVAGEKENEDFSNDAGSDIIPKKHRGRRANTLGRGFKRTNGEDQPEECENGTSDGQSHNDRLRESDSSENINKSPAIKPAQLKGRPQRLIPNLGREWGNRRPQPKTGVQEGRTSARDDNSTKAPSASVQEKEKQQSGLLEFEDVDEEPDLSAVQEQIFNKPTRSGRIPKLSQHVIQAAAEEEEDEEELSDLPTSSKVAQDIQAPRRRPKVKPGPRLKQGMQRRGKSRLVTLQASGTENDDEEEEEVEECVLSQEEFSPIPEEENQAFVPMSLRPLPPVSSEVVETMEELDISVNMPDILGTSQNALCPELACEQTPVPCEHQLDLLVDVIDFLDPDHMEVCREINNEAAQTLLTIGNSAQMMQTSEILCTSGSDVIETSCIVHDEVIHEEVVTETAIMSAPSVGCDSEKSDFELSKCETHIPEPSADETPTPKDNTIKSQTTDAHPGPIQQDIQDSASVSAPPPKRGRFSKPKPNIGQSLRTRQAPQQKINSKGVTESLETLKDPPSTEQDKNESQPMQEHSVPVDQPSDSSAIHSEVLQPDISSERREDCPRDIPKILAEEDKASVSSLNRNNEDVITEDKIKEQEDARSEPQTNSMSDSQSTSDEQSKPVRRPRGPRPKPNLTQTSRQMHAQTKHTMPSVTTVTPEKPSIWAFTKSSEEGTVVNTESNVSHNTARQEATSSIDLAQAVVSEDESRLKTVVTLDEDRTGPEEESNVKPSECESKDTPEEPVFILPPTLDEGVGFRIEPLPSSGVSELDSHGQSASESNNVSHLLITDALVPVSESQEIKSGDDDVDESRKGQLKRKTPDSTSQGNIEGEGQAEHDDLEVLESPVAEVTGDLEHLDQEHLEKKRKLPQRTRRAKLQVKPTPVSRRNTRPKEDTAVLSLKQTTSLPISTSQQPVPATISASAPNSDREAASDNIHSPPQEKNPEESVQEGPSQGIMGQVDIPVKETELASGSASQGVSQTMPVATSGPLTRPGRRPKGFLSFISSKSTQGPAAAHRGAKPGPQKPAVNTSRPERKPRAATEANPLEKRPTPTSASTNEQNSEDEPTSVSKYFFSDIFTEVDELEDMD